MEITSQFTTTSCSEELFNTFQCPKCGNILSIEFYKTKNNKNYYVSINCVYCNSSSSDIIPIKHLSSILNNKIFKNSSIIIPIKCLKHKEKYVAYCKKCQKNLCKECLEDEEKKHKEKIIEFENILFTNNDLYNLKVKIFQIEKYIKEIENIANIFSEHLNNLKNELNSNLINFKILSYKYLNYSKKLLDFYIINKENNLNYNIINNLRKKLKFKDFQQIPTNLLDFIIFLKQIEIFNFENNILSELDKKEYNLNNNENIIYSKLNYLKLIMEKNVIQDAKTEIFNAQIFDLFNKYDIKNNMKDYIIYSNNTTKNINIYDIKNFSLISRIKVNYEINCLKVFTFKNNFYYYYINDNNFYIRDLEHNLKIELKIFSKSYIYSLNYIYYDNKILFVFNSYNSSNLKFYFFDKSNKNDLIVIKMNKCINYVDFFQDKNNNHYLIVSGFKILKCYLLNFTLNNKNNDNKNEDNNIINIEEHKNYIDLIKTKMDINFENNDFNKFVVATLIDDEKNVEKNILIVSNSNYIFFIDFTKDEIIKIVNIISNFNTTLCVWDKYLIYNDGRVIKNVEIINNKKLITNNININNQALITTILKREISYLGDCLLSHDMEGNIKIWDNEN